MLTKVTSKVYHQQSVYDSNGILHDIKLLDTLTSSTRSNKLDRQCVVDTNTTIIPGTELRFGNMILIVSYLEPDYYQGEIIRYTIDCIETTHTIDVYRSTLIKSAQGGLSNKNDLSVYTNVPVKIALSDIVNSKQIDVSIPRFKMYLSLNYSIQVGDRINVSSTKYEVAKVNSLVHLTPGILEVTFDQDPRWP